MNDDICARLNEGVVNIRVGAIIMKDGKVLMVKNEKEGWYYSVGGRIKFGEFAKDAVVREAYEETGYELEVDRLGFVHEIYFYGTMKDDVKRTIYEQSFYFYMKVPEDFEPLYDKADLAGSEHLEWVDLDTEEQIYPEFFRKELKEPKRETTYIYTDERTGD